MNYFLRKLLYSFRDTPITMWLVTLPVVFYILDFLSGSFFMNLLAFTNVRWYEEPHRMLTYPLASSGFFINMVLGTIILWFIGTNIEQELGSRKFAGFILFTTYTTAFCSVIGYYISQESDILAGTYILTSCMFLVWCARNIEREIYFWGLFPMKTRVFAALIVLLTVASMRWPMAALVLIPLGMSYLFATDRIPFWKYTKLNLFDGRKRKEEKNFKEYLDSVYKRQQEREEQKRLRELFERSFGNDYKESDNDSK